MNLKKYFITKKIATFYSVFNSSIGINKHYFGLSRTISKPKIINKMITPNILYCLQRNNNISLSNEMITKLISFKNCVRRQSRDCKPNCM